MRMEGPTAADIQTHTKIELTQLISKLKAAPIGTRGLDYDIHQAIGWQDNDECGWSRADVRTDSNWPFYTTSIDSALTLVLEGRLWSIGCIVKAPGFVAILNNSGVSYRGATPALALCVAALEARK